VPHVWLERDRKRLSTIDLVGHGRFTVLTGIGGEAWRAAASLLALPIQTFTIGPAGCDAQDIYGDWYTASEIEEDGCIVVRPDMHVAWRSPTLVADPNATLASVFARLLG
jgi:2,4-dichlorophenol 6-monooxygenase